VELVGGFLSDRLMGGFYQIVRLKTINGPRAPLLHLGEDGQKGRSLQKSIQGPLLTCAVCRGIFLTCEIGKRSADGFVALARTPLDG